jgi:hypothetical protein
MFKPFLIAGLLCLSAQAVLAETGHFADASGRWVCKPDQPHWPQILIDFTDKAYRRCDQNTCVSYDIESLQIENSAAIIGFAPRAVLKTGETGGTYRETMYLGDQVTEITGFCAFRADSEVYDLNQIQPKS